MKKLFLLFFIILLRIDAFTQVPQTFKYQAVVRDNIGNVLVNKLIAVRSSLLKGSITGNVEYSEVHTIATNEFGVINLSIGLGSVQSGNFNTINWGSDIYFIKTEVDLNGGNNFTFMGTSQLLSVPYALYAAKSGSNASDNDTSATNEIQTLNINGNNLNISNGNTVPIDTDPTNELQAISLINDTLYLSNGGKVWVGKYYQNLSLSGNQLQISNGNSITITGVLDLDADPTNELQLLSRNNDTLFLSKGNFVNLPPELDGDTTNELQSLQLNAGTLALTKANSIHLPDSSSTNELQALSVSNDTIFIENGGFIKIPIATNAIVPSNTCINSTSPTPPSGYTYSGNSFQPNIGKWTSKNSYGSTIKYKRPIYYKGKIYFMGGEIGSTCSNNVIEYDISTNLWQPKSPMPSLRESFMMTVCNNKIYVIGGSDCSSNNYLNNCEEYNPLTDTWTIKSTMPTSRRSSYIFSVNNKIYVLAGTTIGGLLTDAVEEFDPASNTWTTKMSFPNARTHAAFDTSNGKIYFMGGDIPNSNNSSTLLDIYNTTTNSWNSGFLPVGRRSAIGLNVKDNIYLIGGTGTNSVDIYDINTTLWRSVRPINNSTDDNEVVGELNGRIYSFAGAANYNQVYDPNYDFWTNFLPAPDYIFQYEECMQFNNKFYFARSTGLGIDIFEYTPPITYFIHCAN